MPDWSKLFAAPDFRVTGTRVRVSFPNGRSHRVAVTDTPHAYELCAVVLAAEAVSGHARGDDSRRLDLALRTWRCNETAQLCGFRLDADGALVGEATVPKIGLDVSELRERVRALARASDLLEMNLTGEDVE